MRGGMQRKITSYFRKSKKRSSSSYSKSAKRRKYSGKRRNSFSYTPADARVGQTQKLARQGPYKRPSYQPRLKGTGHRAETQYTWNSSIAGPSPNPLALAVNQFGAAYKVQSGTVLSSNSITGFDAYFQQSQNAPWGFTKVFQKAVKVKLICLNDKETAGKVRVVFAKLRKGMSGTLPGQWNSDVNRPIATRHWKVIKMESFIMEPVTYTDAGVANGITTIEKNYYIPINKWRFTNTGDPATSGAAWQMTTYHPQEVIYMFIDTSDLNPTGSVIQFSMYVNDYFSTVETTQT